MTPTHFRKPKTGDRLLKVTFRNGMVSRHSYKASQLIWSDRGWDFDVIAVERAA
jgi:hypothetical protein